MSSLFPTFEPYWIRSRQKLTATLNRVSWRFSQTSPYFKVAFAANIVGITGLAYLLLKLSFPELFFSEEEIADNFVSDDIASLITVMFYIFFLSVSLTLLIISAIKNTRYHRAFSLVSIILGASISITVIWGIFFS
jgi:uncharacterized membrane protein YqjE